MGFVFHIGLKNQSRGFHSETVRVFDESSTHLTPITPQGPLSLEHSSTESRCQVHTELFIKNRGFQIRIQDDRVRPAAGQVRPARSPKALTFCSL
ncbi:hypothetical protein QQF64_016298 [Cirrhinus molitorella]|uniref:Uncharacterized protein n=1 Tax=Cirrhinus molitorella TaxID=172907 RepID=A0ABR3LQX1_9TELE